MLCDGVRLWRCLAAARVCHCPPQANRCSTTKQPARFTRYTGYLIFASMSNQERLGRTFKDRPILHSGSLPHRSCPFVREPLPAAATPPKSKNQCCLGFRKPSCFLGPWGAANGTATGNESWQRATPVESEPRRCHVLAAHAALSALLEFSHCDRLGTVDTRRPVPSIVYKTRACLGMGKLRGVFCRLVLAAVASYRVRLRILHSIQGTAPGRSWRYLFVQSVVSILLLHSLAAV
jgi:hypothetical protein